jgi:hypothetical protein
VLFSGDTAPKVIPKLLEVTPPAIEGELESSGKRYPIIHSQPISHSFKWDDPGKIVELYFVQLVDFGNGHSLVTSGNLFTYTAFSTMGWHRAYKENIYGWITCPRNHTWGQP